MFFLVVASLSVELVLLPGNKHVASNVEVGNSRANVVGFIIDLQPVSAHDRKRGSSTGFTATRRVLVATFLTAAKRSKR